VPTLSLAIALATGLLIALLVRMALPALAGGLAGAVLGLSLIMLGAWLVTLVLPQLIPAALSRARALAGLALFALIAALCSIAHNIPLVVAL
jgi:hypothetical protein